MTEEYQSIIKNDVWEIVPKPKSKDVVLSKWLFKIKHAADGSIEKYKARFVARGFSQKEGIDYEETFAPVARYTSIRTIIALVAMMKWKLHQMDVKTAFLNGVIEEEVYIEQPQGFEVEDRKSHVCRLKKALYGLKQAPRAWYGRIDSFLTCYPRYLGITRRSCLEAHMVLDMEYREQELPEHGPGGPFFFFSARFVLPAVPASITTGLGLHQRRLLLHEVIGPRYHGMCHI
jgi:hypothetical protein